MEREYVPLEEKQRLASTLLLKMRQHAPELRRVLDDVNSKRCYEDRIYRYYHQSFKVLDLQNATRKMADVLAAISPEGRPFCRFVDEILQHGMGREFSPAHNQHWLERAAPIVQAFFHARYFVEMAVKYAALADPPQPMLSGWAALNMAAFVTTSGDLGGEPMPKNKHRQSTQPSQNVRLAGVPKVGIFFVVGGKLWVKRILWTDNPSLAGFRTYAVGHPDCWLRLQEAGAVPRDLEYKETARGRVNYEDASGKFTLFADRCIIQNKRLVGKIINELSLPENTSVLPDDHYRCPKCLGEKPIPKQEKDDWGF